jgi:hypothetical protein
MKMIGSAVEAVLKAAESWVTAQEALVAAKQVSKETEDEEEAVDNAGTQLVLAVRRWRSERGLQLTEST